LAGDFSGQVLSPDGTFFSAELPLDGYNTAVFDRNGILHFNIGTKAKWAQVFNYEGDPNLFCTEGVVSVIYTRTGRDVVASTVPCYRGSLFLVDGQLWALTISDNIDGKTVGFMRPWQSTKGIRVDMWGGFAVAHYNPTTRMITCAGFNQDTGEILGASEIPVDSARKDISETPDYGGTTPPVTPPTIGDDISIDVRGPINPGQRIVIRIV
jgi:hypothetical protein